MQGRVGGGGTRTFRITDPRRLSTHLVFHSCRHHAARRVLAGETELGIRSPQLEHDGGLLRTKIHTEGRCRTRVACCGSGCGCGCGACRSSGDNGNTACGGHSDGEEGDGKEGGREKTTGCGGNRQNSCASSTTLLSSSESHTSGWLNPGIKSAWERQNRCLQIHLVVQ